MNTNGMFTHIGLMIYFTLKGHINSRFTVSTQPQPQPQPLSP